MNKELKLKVDGRTVRCIIDGTIPYVESNKYSDYEYGKYTNGTRGKKYAGNLTITDYRDPTIAYNHVGDVIGMSTRATISIITDPDGNVYVLPSLTRIVSLELSSAIPIYGYELNPTNGMIGGPGTRPMFKNGTVTAISDVTLYQFPGLQDNPLGMDTYVQYTDDGEFPDSRNALVTLIELTCSYKGPLSVICETKIGRSEVLKSSKIVTTNKIALVMFV